MKDTDRPDPELLLRRYGFDESEPSTARGALRIYLGAAPGVGKTYTMLNEGRRLSAAGKDVVAGYIEAHGRQETEAQLGSLEVVPRQSIEHRGISIDEMDTPAILDRNPDIVLVDELAHTNAPGSPNEKRWQDVELLRDAGIHVISTLNIQHIASLSGVVESITGVKVRETIPDQVLNDASEVQLVDLPVAALIERLELSKVYPDGRAQQALGNFFREGNLTALRELALRRTAAGVDQQLENYMREHEIEAVWPAAERILLLLPAHQDAGSVIRSGWRLADGFRAELLAIAIVPPGGIRKLPAGQQRDLQAAIELAEDLGAIVRIVESSDALGSVVQTLHDENASTLVLGYSLETGLRQRLKTSFVDQLLQSVEGVEVHLVEFRKAEANGH